MPKHYRPAGKKKEGNVAKYITRNKALNRLQLKLPEFRRLCILKGVFPREPKKKLEGNNKTYYHLKDIGFLAHEPLLKKFRLSLEWQAYISRTHSLRKTFVSVKGIYYQAEVEGQKITWLTPHVLHQVIPDDVDFRVMLTFVEFYETLLGFVNFKLYNSISLKYPPILDPQLEAAAAELYAMVKDLASTTANPRGEDASDVSQENISGESEPIELERKERILAESQARLALLQHQISSMDKERAASNGGQQEDTLMQIKEQSGDGEDDDEETKMCRTLFKDLKVFLSREVPRESLLFVIPAFGGMVSWQGDGAPFKETDEGITHQIVDRPTQGHMFLSRDYCQPQWVYDCVNSRLILPTEGYMVGRVPPPHLSPFVDNEAEGYLPEYAESIKRLQVAAKKQLLPMPGMEDEDIHDPQKTLAEAIARRNEANEAAEKEREEVAIEKVYQEDLAKELLGIPYSASSLGKAIQELQDVPGKEEELPGTSSGPEKDADDTKSMAQIMMSRKKRKLYEAMQIGKSRKRANVELLQERKRKAEKARA